MIRGLVEVVEGYMRFDELVESYLRQKCQSLVECNKYG